MKAILVPYARACECSWAEEVFPGRSVAALPVCGKPAIAYSLDELSRRGVTEVTIVDGHYDRRLAKYLGTGSKWGMKLIYTGGDDRDDELAVRKRHSAFLGDDEAVVVFGNSVAGNRIDSLKAYYDVNLSLLEDPLGCVIPGYGVEKGVYIGTNVVIRPGADVKGPVCLGDDVRVERGVRILPRSVLCDGCAIDVGTEISESVIFPGTYVGKHVEIVRKIVVGSRVIDPFSGAWVDLDDDGISESVEAGGLNPMPATAKELHTVSYTGAHDAATDGLIADALADLARDIASLDMSKLEGVYLGGGYGRGEGGAPLYNDLDFFPLVRDVTENERAEIQVALDTLAMSYAFRLGVHVDFCRPKTSADFRHDESRIMVQEFVRGNVPVYGSASSLWFLNRLPEMVIPVSEALRTLVNRGMGLYLARDSEDREFVNRNINKAVLGAGDAVLVAEHHYRWTVAERTLELAGTPYEAAYEKAVELKFRPTGEAVVTWDEARKLWETAAERITRLHGIEFSTWKLRQGVRYVARRHRLGSICEFGIDPLVRILDPLRTALSTGEKLDPETMKDWEVFN